MTVATDLSLSGSRAATAPKAAGSGACEAAQRPSLGTYTHNSSTAGQSDGQGRQWFSLRDWQHRKVDRSDPRQVQAARDDARAERWELRRRLRRVFRTERVKSCGQAGARPDGSVALRYTPAGGGADGRSGAVAGYAGLFRCNNVWLCADCSVRKSAIRAEDIALVLAYFIARGGWAVLVTLTGRHWREHSLKQCTEATGKAWSRVTSGGAWSRDVRLSEYAGFVRALEITESPDNGWHAHVHAILVFEKRPSRDVLDHLTGGMFARWSSALVRAGLPAPLIEHGLDVQELDTSAAPEHLAEQSMAWARYVAKGLATEATMGATKTAKNGNRTIRDLMRAAVFPTRFESPATGAIVETVDLTARARLREYERVTKGRKQLTWSQKAFDLRARVGLEPEQAEDAEDDELDGEEVAILPPESWRMVEPRATELLSVCERQGPDGARAWLDAHGIEWWRPTGLSEHLRRRTEPPGG